MIRREDLLEAIAECEGTRHPTASTCLKLASYYTILRQMDGEGAVTSSPPAEYSFASSPTTPVSETEFARVVAGKGYAEVMPILDEAMTALLVTNQRMYEGVMRQLRSL